MNNELNKYITFKANQYLRTTGENLTSEEAKNWLISQVKNKTDLLKGWIGEAIAAGV